MNRVFLLAVTFLAVLGLGTFAHAADPVRGIPYTGRLEIDGQLPNASMPMTFTLWDQLDKGTGNRRFEETQTVEVVGGHFAVVLGKTKPLPDEVFTDAALFVEVAIAGATLEPRQQVYAAPQSVRATYDTFRVKQWLHMGPGQAAVHADGRLHLSSDSDLLLLADQGVHITKDWGSSGALSVAGPTALNGGASASSLTVSGATSSGSLSVTGASTLTGGVSGNLNVTGTLSAGTTDMGIVYPACDGSVAWKAGCSCPPGTRILTGGVYCLSPSFVAYSYPDFTANTWWAGCALCTNWGGDGCWGQTWIHLACAKIQ